MTGTMGGQISTSVGFGGFAGFAGFASLASVLSGLATKIGKTRKIGLLALGMAVLGAKVCRQNIQMVFLLSFQVLGFMAVLAREIPKPTRSCLSQLAV